MTSCTCMPGQAARTRPYFMISSSTRLARLIGIAKPMPSEPPPLREDERVDADDLAVAVHQRAAAVAGIDGGVGLDHVLVHAALGRLRLDVAPRRADHARGDGRLRVVRAGSRTDCRSRSPTRPPSDRRCRRAAPPAAGRRRSCSTARSYVGLAPSSLPGSCRPSARVTVICSASRTTCSLVSTSPFGSTITPEPSAGNLLLVLASAGRSDRRTRRANTPPNGSLRTTRVCSTLTDTTAGLTRCAAVDDRGAARRGQIAARRRRARAAVAGERPRQRSASSTAARRRPCARAVQRSRASMRRRPPARGTVPAAAPLRPGLRGGRARPAPRASRRPGRRRRSASSAVPTMLRTM